MPRSLDVARLSAFTAPRHAPRERVAQPSPDPSHLASWPSREPVSDGQISIKAPVDVIDRFRKLCRDDRRTYADMLGILMDRFEGSQGR